MKLMKTISKSQTITTNPNYLQANKDQTSYYSLNPHKFEQKSKLVKVNNQSQWSSTCDQPMVVPRPLEENYSSIPRACVVSHESGCVMNLA